MMKCKAMWMFRKSEKMDMKLRIDHRDRRHVEFAVFGLPFWGGIPLLCDVTQGSPLKVDGSPHPKACTVPGGAIERGEKRKPQQYREAWQARGRVKLLTLACETGGRWSDQCVDFVRMLAKHKAREAPPVLQRSAEYGWQSRWWTLLSCSAHRTFAASITELDTKLMQPSTGPARPKPSTGPRVSRSGASMVRRGALQCLGLGCDCAT